MQVGELVVLYKEGSRPLFVELASGKKLIDGFGVVDLTPAVGAPEGARVVAGGEEYLVLRPALVDLTRTARRPTQIVTPKDAQYLLFLAGVTAGARVVEAGTGSGLLTLFLANAVGPGGQVVTYDRKSAHQDAAQALLRRSGLADRVLFRQGDVSEGIEEREVDSVIFDLPEPWTATAHAWGALRAGGFLATYIPTYNQLEHSVREMRTVGFSDVHALELIERPIQVGEGGTRPSFEMLGHTGFLAAGRKVGVRT